LLRREGGGRREEGRKEEGRRRQTIEAVGKSPKSK